MMSLDQSRILREGNYWKSSSRSFLHRDGYNIVTIFSDHCQLYSEREGNSITLGNSSLQVENDGGHATQSTNDGVCQTVV